MNRFLQCLFLGTLLACQLSSSERDLESESKKNEAKICIPSCKAIVLMDDDKGYDCCGEIEGLVTNGIFVPNGKLKLEARLKRFFNCPINSETIKEIKKEIQCYYEQQNEPFLTLYVPPQRISEGVLRIVVRTSCYGKCQIEGACWTPCETLQRYISNVPGTKLNEVALRKDIEFMNRNYFRHVNAILSPGETPNTTDVTFVVKERNRARVYAGADNTGVPTTGRQRLYTGLNWGKAFGLDHIFSYQYTTSYNFSKFQGHTVQYLALLSWKHLLNVYGGYSTVHAELPFPTMRTHGMSAQGSLRYTIPLNPMHLFTHEVSLGCDFKRTNNTLEFSDIYSKFGKNVNLTQLAGEYRFESAFQFALVNFTGQLFYSPGRIVSDQTNSDYNSLRPHAKNQYVYTRCAANFLFYLPYESYFNFLVRGQIASQNLLPSEQFGIGGYDTVRGYDERQLNMDAALLMNWEFRSPYIPVFHYLKPRAINDAIQFLAFIDYGYGSNHNTIPGEPDPEFLLSAGPGMRYTLDPYVAVRLDWGIKLHHKEVFTGGSSMVHFAATVSY